jgi:hypothetical protein
MIIFIYRDRLFFSIVLFYLLSVIPCTNLNAQQLSKGTVKGIVIDETKNSLPFATIILKIEKDSSFYKGVLTDNEGTFAFNGVNIGDYRIEIKVIGYETLRRRISITDTSLNINIGIVQLSPLSKQLNTVNIVSSKPFIERRADMIVINLNNNINDGSVLDLMNKLPDVSVNLNDQISLEGKGVQIYIDGRPSTLTPQALAGFLRGMPPSSIQKIELIAHPSSKYDAAGNRGIINIVRKRNTNNGLSGNIYGGIEQAQYGKQNGGINLNYKQKGTTCS